MPNNSTIAKILPFEFAADLLLNKVLFFSRPSTWDDPFEKLNDYLNNEMVFAQCWSKSTYSDAMWRIFTQNKGLTNYGPGIQVRTKVKILKKAIQKSILNQNINLISNDVEYIPLEDYEQMLRENPEELIFKKRRAFRHELEYRFVLTMDNSVYEKFKYNNGIKIPLKGNIEDIIDDVIWIDPFSSHFLTRAIKKFFKGSAFSCVQSKIYTGPQEKFRNTRI